MKWVVLSDNRNAGYDLETEHGLCIYLETAQHKYLLDTGASDIFLKNANRLNIHPEDIDYVLISHGHSDHLGGLPHFLKRNTKAKIILSSAILHQKYCSKRDQWHDISTAINVGAYHNRFLFVYKAPFQLGEIQAFHNDSTNYPTPLGNKHLYQKTLDNDYIPDTFNHELIFTIGTDSLLVYTGCAHLGVQNILTTVQNQSTIPIDCVVGGFHLISAKNKETYETEAALFDIGKDLKHRYPKTLFYTGHCTGEKPFDTLKQVMGSQLNSFHVGLSIETQTI